MNKVREKVCIRCGESKPAIAECFYQHPRMKDGLLNKCKECYRAAVAARRRATPDLVRERNKSYRIRNQEAIRSQAAAWYHANAEKHYATCTAWREKNRDRLNAHLRAKYATDPSGARRRYMEYWHRNKEAILALRRQKRLANLDAYRERAREQQAKRRAAKLGAGGIHNRAEVIALAESRGWLCAYCNAPLDIRTVTEDHVIPLSRGGSDGIENIVPACMTCNLSKGARLPSEFVPVIARF